jgi:membrane-associated protein
MPPEQGRFSREIYEKEVNPSDRRLFPQVLTSNMNTMDKALLPLSPISPMEIYAVLAILIIIEIGLIFGFFFPGDFLLLAVGILAGSYADISLMTTISVAVVASFIGAELGFFIGKKYGFVLTRNQNPPNIVKTIEKAKKYLVASDWLTVLASNFIPGLRSFVPVIAGQGSMGWMKYLSANALGSIAWGSAITFIGYKLASITAIQESPFVIVAGLFLVSSGASIVNYLKAM